MLDVDLSQGVAPGAKTVPAVPCVCMQSHESQSKSEHLQCSRTPFPTTAGWGQGTVISTEEGYREHSKHIVSSFQDAA